MPSVMINLPSCRYSLAMFLKEMGITDPSAVHVALVGHIEKYHDVGTDTAVEPRRLMLSFDYFTADVLRNPTLERLPRFIQECRLLRF
jgi:hypothetical protein